MVVETREPTDGPHGRRIRQIAAEGRDGVTPEEELELFMADRREHVAGVVRPALARGDVLALSGGVSAGDYDFVGDALEAEGVEKVFHKVHMKPGKPLWYGRRGAKHVFGLPGNPASSQVTARLYMVPLLRRLTGRSDVFDPELTLPLLAPFRGTGDRPTFQPAEIDWTAPGIRLLKTHGSGDKRNFARGTTLAALPPNRASFEPGDPITVLLDEESL